MPGEPQSRTIGEHTYSVSPFGVRLGLKVLTKLIKLLGPAVKALAGGNSLAAIGAISDSLDPDQVLSLAEQFSEYIHVEFPDGKRPQLKTIFDVHFRADYGHMIELLAFAVEVNYGSFLAELAAKGTEKSPATQLPSGASLVKT